jgi:beta-lactamase regulating signal transducer with metallopeptidase domain
MIAAWMLYAAACAALLAGAAALLDRALRLGGRATRGVWAAAMVGSVLVPAAALLPREASPPASPAVATIGDGAGAEQLAALLEAARLQARAAVSPALTLEALDRPLLALWLASSAATVGWLLLSHRRLRGRAGQWSAVVVADQPVLLSADVGPAVVGLLSRRVVLPAWALALDARSLELMLAHEREHVRTADPLLLGAAALAAALQPWNPAVWWQLHRLRLAVEMDCDARVLRRHPDVRTYGRLLLDVARHAPAGARLPVAALTSPATSLERRIRTMTMRRPRHASAHVAGLSAAGLLLAAAACEAPRPTAPVPRSEAPITAITSSSPSVASAEGITDDRLRAAIAEHLPALATRHGRAQRAWFVVDASGRVVQAIHDDSPTAPLRTMDSVPVTSDASGVRARVQATRQPAKQSVPSALTSVDPAHIRSIDVRKLRPGQMVPDSLSVVWIQLRAPGEVAASRTRTPATFKAELRPSTRVRVDSMRVRVDSTRRFGSDSGITFRRDSSYRGDSTYRPSRVSLRRDGDSARTISFMRTTGTTEPVGLRRAQRAPGTPEPLYLIDGRELPADQVEASMKALDPADIEKIEVQKNEQAVARYGDRARGGVIHITTKRR